MKDKRFNEFRVRVLKRYASLVRKKGGIVKFDINILLELAWNELNHQGEWVNRSNSTLTNLNK